MKRILVLSIWMLVSCLFSGLNNKGQNPPAEKIMLITLDGFRWQELFTGADSLLIDNEDYVSDASGLKKSSGAKHRLRDGKPYFPLSGIQLRR